MSKGLVFDTTDITDPTNRSFFIFSHKVVNYEPSFSRELILK